MDLSYGALVFREEQETREFLLIHSARGKCWDIPKGHPEEGERPEEAARREVLEETNWQYTPVPGFEEAIEYVLPRGEDKRVVFFLGRALEQGEEKIDGGEIHEVRWFGYEEAREIISYDNSREILEKAHAFLS